MGTTTRVRMDWSNDGRDPWLGDVTLESGSSRWYEVVGVEEHRDSPRVWWIVLERIAPARAELLYFEGRGYWPHVRYRRGRPT